VLKFGGCETTRHKSKPSSNYSLLRTWDPGKFYASLEKAAKIPVNELKEDGNRAIMLCTTTDPYQMFRAGTADRTNELNARAEQLVRNSLEIIRDHYDLNVRILTRSPLAKKHFELFKSFGKRLLFGMSLPTMNDRLCKLYEPNAPGPKVRLKTLQEAREAGLNVFVAVAPTYPECDENDLRLTLYREHQISETGYGISRTDQYQGRQCGEDCSPC
jgi:DNA repair photolyase